jgi:hypothetical protein
MPTENVAHRLREPVTQVGHGTHPGRRVYRRIALNPIYRCKPSGTHPENSSPTNLTDRDFAGEQVVRG